ncbi:MAG: hypothetical protein WCW93_00610 [Candidatus Paceibacterota bacterium]
MKVKKIALLVIPALLFSFTALANDTNYPINEYDSIYRYNALENKTSFMPSNPGDDSDQSDVMSPVNNELTDDIKKLKDIIERQNSSIEQSENAMKNIMNRNGVETFLLGNNLGILKFQMVQMEDQGYKLKALAFTTKDSTLEIKIKNQIDILNKEKSKVENFIYQRDNNFSLFGWLVN